MCNKADESGPSLQTYMTGLESVVIDQLMKAGSSIRIVMAWFTSQKIKDALISVARNNPGLSIGIVVDDNEINNRHFFNNRAEFEKSGIRLFVNLDKRFLHRKFMVIDEQVTVIGSYNYTNRARNNAENVAVIRDQLMANVHTRIYRQLTEANYLDENIKLLFRHPFFAQELLSTYYKFSRVQYQRFASKIILGDCFTYDVGNYDQLRYTPGFIFNPRANWDKKLRNEFELPVSKKEIQAWFLGRDQELILDGYRELEHLWHEIGPELERNEAANEKYFQHIIDSIYTSSMLEEKIVNGLDLIREDHLWEHNFKLFITDEVVEDLFDTFPQVDRIYPLYDLEKVSLFPDDAEYEKASLKPTQFSKLI